MQYWKTIINGFVTASTINADGEGNIAKAEHDSIVEMYRGAPDGYGVVETESGWEYAPFPACPVELFPSLAADRDYWKGDRVRDPADGNLYKLILETPEGHPHHSQSDWPPRLVPAVWVRVDNPAEEWPEWQQPQGAHDAYAAGRKVSHNGKHWINTYGDGNIWEPGVFGWEEVT